MVLTCVRTCSRQARHTWYLHALEHVLALIGHLHRPDLAGKPEQVDKSLRIMMIIQVSGGKGSNAFIVQCIRGSGACLDNIAFGSSVQQ